MKRPRNPFRYFSLRRLFNNKSGLGAPVGNLIILVAAVALATTVVLFAINVTSNQVQKENLQITDVSLNPSNCTICILNTGSTSISVSQVTVKGDKYSASSFNDTVPIIKGNSTALLVALRNGTITDTDVGRTSTIVLMTTQGSYFSETIVKALSSG